MDDLHHYNLFDVLYYDLLLCTTSAVYYYLLIYKSISSISFSPLGCSSCKWTRSLFAFLMVLRSSVNFCVMATPIRVGLVPGKRIVVDPEQKYVFTNYHSQWRSQREGVMGKCPPAAPPPSRFICIYL
jgi:hypothetical protein